MSSAQMLCHPRIWQVGFLAMLLVLVAGCAEVRLISDYDAYTDEKTGVLQRKAEELFTSLERGPQLPECSHASHEGFYAEATVELNLLIARNTMRPKNRITLEQLMVLKNSFQALEELHQLADEESRCLSIEEVSLSIRPGFESSFRAILELELAKKRGEGESS